MRKVKIHWQVDKFVEEVYEMTKLEKLIDILENKLEILEEDLTDLINKIEDMKPSKQKDSLNVDRAELLDQIDYVWQDLIMLKKQRK